jgi:hypothetical protein
MSDPQEDKRGGDDEEPPVLEPVKESEIEVRNWFQNRREGATLLKVIVENKTTDSLKIKVQIKHDEESETPCNVRFPLGEMNENHLFAKEKKCLVHMEKINQVKAFSKIKVTVQTKKKQIKQFVSNSNAGSKLNSQ